MPTSTSTKQCSSDPGELGLGLADDLTSPHSHTNPAFLADAAAVRVSRGSVSGEEERGRDEEGEGDEDDDELSVEEEEKLGLVGPEGQRAGTVTGTQLLHDAVHTSSVLHV